MKKKILVIILILSIFSQFTPYIKAQTANTQAQNNEIMISLLKQVIALLLKQVELLQIQLQAKLQAEGKIITEQLPIINAKAIVYLECVYKTKPGREMFVSGSEQIGRASGAIVNPEGYILTVRHLVDPAWSVTAYPNDANINNYKNLADNYELSFCNVAPPSAENLPTVSQIQQINPGTPVSPFAYVAKVNFTPSKTNLGNIDYNSLDFAILKITGLANCAINTACNTPTVYPYTPVTMSGPQINDQVISYGYPIEAVSGFTPQLKGAFGTLKEFFGGDIIFNNTPLTFEWLANGSREGRSGSPIFLKNKIMGIELGAEKDNVTINYGLGLTAIAKILQSAGLQNLLATQ